MVSRDVIVLPNGVIQRASGDTGATQRLLTARLAAVMARLAPSTRRTYLNGLRQFALWHAKWLPDADKDVQSAYPNLDLALSATDWQVLIFELMEAGPLLANLVVDTFLDLGCKGRAAETIRSRASALRWPFAVANGEGVIIWRLNVRGPKAVPYRDSSGPGLVAIRAILAVADAIEGEIGARDSVLVRLAYILAHRRSEAVSPDVGAYQCHTRKIWITGKGKDEAEKVTVPKALAVRIDRYLALRGNPAEDEPLLLSYDRAGKGTGRLTPDGAYKRISWLANKAGIPGRVTPHGFRHSAITDALEATDGDVRRVNAFARHSKLDTTLLYDDHRRDFAGEIANILADLLEAELPKAPENTSDVPETAQYQEQLEPRLDAASARPAADRGGDE